MFGNDWVPDIGSGVLVLVQPGRVSCYPVASVVFGMAVTEAAAIPNAAGGGGLGKAILERREWAGGLSPSPAMLLVAIEQLEDFFDRLQGARQGHDDHGPDGDLIEEHGVALGRGAGHMLRFAGL